MTPLSYSELRERTRARDRSLRDKVMSLEEAAALVRDGDQLAVGGCTASRTPFAMIWALVRSQKRGLTVSRSIMSTDGDIFYASGLSTHLITSWFSQGIVWGVSKVMRAYTESGRARFEEWSHMAMGLRYRAGAMGVPFLPMRSMLGSDVLGRVSGDTGPADAAFASAKTMACPFTGETLLAVPALNPDVAIIHVQRCDPYGNAQLDGLTFMDIDIAMAANRVILTTERVVSNEQIRRQPDQTKIGFFTVDAVVEVPFGCAPHECYGLYEPFYSHMDMYAEMTGRDPEAGAQAYLERFYHEPKDWADYLARIGMAELIDAQRRGSAIYDD